MSDQNKHAWTTLQLMIVGVIMVSPFWFFASDLKDLSEMKSTLIGGAMSGVALAAAELFKHLRKDKM